MGLLEILDTFIAKVNPEWKAIHHVADKHLEHMTDIYVASFEALRTSVNVDSLSKTEDIRHMPQHIKWGVFDDSLDDAYLLTGLILSEAGEVAAKYMPEQFKSTVTKTATPKIPKVGLTGEGLTLEGAFNMRNPRAVQWATDHTGELIRQVDKVTRAGVQEVITHALNYGGHPRETARQIRQYIGLTDRQVSGILKYQAKLDESGRSQKRVDAMVDSQIRRKVRERALTIARTETIAASCAGQQLHWEDQTDKGILDKRDLVKEWIVTPDDKLCTICSAMAGKKVEIDAVFNFGGKTPPRHPRCRCAIGLVERPGQEIDVYAQTTEGQDWSKVDRLLDGSKFDIKYEGEVSETQKVELTKHLENTLLKLQSQYPNMKVPIKKVTFWERTGGRMDIIEADERGMATSWELNIPNKISKPKIQTTLDAKEDGLFMAGRNHIDLKIWGVVDNNYEFIKDAVERKIAAGISITNHEELIIHEIGHMVVSPDIKDWGTARNAYKVWAKETDNLFSAYGASDLDEGLAEAFVEYTRGTYKVGMLPDNIEKVFFKEIDRLTGVVRGNWNKVDTAMMSETPKQTLTEQFVRVVKPEADTAKANKIIDDWFNSEDPEYALNTKNRNFLEDMLKTDKALENMVVQSQEVYKGETLYRGHITGGNKKYKTGNLIDFKLSSWSSEFNAAQEYAVGNGDGGVVFEILNGVNKSDIALSDVITKQHLHMLNEKEFVTFSNKFEIVKSENIDVWGNKTKKVILKLSEK